MPRHWGRKCRRSAAIGVDLPLYQLLRDAADNMVGSGAGRRCRRQAKGMNSQPASAHWAEYLLSFFTAAFSVSRLLLEKS